MRDSSVPIDPYATPASDPIAPESDPAVDPAGCCYRDGIHMLAKNGAKMPEICPLSGKQVTTAEGAHSYLFSWRPPRIYAFSLVVFVATMALSGFKDQIGDAFHLYELPHWMSMVVIQLPMYAGVYAFTRTNRTAKISGVMDPAIHRSNTWRASLGIGLGLASIACILMGLYLDRAASLLPFSTLLIVCAPIPLFWIKRLRTIHHREGLFVVKGCHRNFLDALPPIEPGA